MDDRQHVNDFIPAEALEAAALTVPAVNIELETSLVQMRYQRVRELLGELKALGAHNMNHARPTGLMPRHTLQGMLQAYEQFRVDGYLPASYDVIFGVLEKV